MATKRPTWFSDDAACETLGDEDIERAIGAVFAQWRETRGTGIGKPDGWSAEYRGQRIGSFSTKSGAKAAVITRWQAEQPTPKHARQIKRDVDKLLAPAPSLADRARAAGHEPETKAGGRAMLQSVTMADVQRAEVTRKLATLKRGDEIEVEHHQVGGVTKHKAIVTWDHGKRVAAQAFGRSISLERTPSGALRYFT